MSKFNLPIIMGNSAAFVNFNPNVICADNNQNNIQIAVTNNIPALILNSNNNHTYLELDDEGTTNITDYFSISKDGDISGNFIDINNLSMPRTSDLDANQALYFINTIMSEININNTFFNWIISLQSGDTPYDAIKLNIEQAETTFDARLLSEYPNLDDYNLQVRIVVATTEGVPFYDTNAISYNTYADATALPSKIGNSIHTYPSVMTVQTKTYVNAYEHITRIYPSVPVGEYICAQRIGDLGSNFGTVMFSFRINEPNINYNNNVNNDAFQ